MMITRIRNAGLVFVLVILTTSLSVAQTSEPGQQIEPAAATNPTTVFYQGYITVSEQPHQGTGYFKFAVINAAGSTSYWSNNGTSVAGSEPTAAISLDVQGGYFGLLLGDTLLGGMTQTLSPSVFSGPGRYLRIWFATSPSGPYTVLSPIPMAAVPYALNAETLDGYDASQIASKAAFSGGEQQLQLSTTPTIVRSVTITAPSSGTVLVNASGWADFNGTGIDTIRCSITTGNQIDTAYLTRASDLGATFTDAAFASFALTRGYNVTAGTRTYNLVCDATTEASSVEVEDTNISALFIP